MFFRNISDAERAIREVNGRIIGTVRDAAGQVVVQGRPLVVQHARDPEVGPTVRFVVRGLAPSVSHDDLKDLFTPYNTVVSADIVNAIG